MVPVGEGGDYIKGANWPEEAELGAEVNTSAVKDA